MWEDFLCGRAFYVGGLSMWEGFVSPKFHGNLTMNTTKKGYHQLRKGRHSIPGNFYLLTTTTHNRRPVLTKNGGAQIIFNAFEWLETKERIRWYCIMIMPDHLHAIIQLRAQDTLPGIMHTLKRFTARQINKLLKQEGPFWQDGYHDSGIRSDTVLNEMIRYCYENPVRKGLVEIAKDYPYWRCKFEMEASGLEAPPTKI